MPPLSLLIKSLPPNSTPASSSAPPSPDSPEDILASSLSILYPGDATNQHGEPGQRIAYTSPNLPRTIELALADPSGEEDRWLFAHYLWNSSVVLAGLIEAGKVDVEGRRVLELGAGAGLSGIVAAIRGASKVTLTDYPSTPLLSTLQTNISKNLTLAQQSCTSIEGLDWSSYHVSGFAAANLRSYDVVLSADCLWMGGMHDDLTRTMAHFLRDSAKEEKEAEVWIVAGFHTGRRIVKNFFEGLIHFGLRYERRWEVDVDGIERPWLDEREGEGIGEAKRWVVVAQVKWGNFL